MEYEGWLKSLKAGDTVVLEKFGWGYDILEERTVSKITQKGFIKVDTFLFDSKTGACRGPHDVNILDPKDEDTINRLREWEKEKYIMTIMGKMRDIVDITYEQAVEINKILENSK